MHSMFLPRKLHLSRNLQRFADALGVDVRIAFFHHTVLIDAAHDLHPRGFLDTMSRVTVAGLSQWTGDPDVFWEALLSSGLLNQEGDLEHFPFSSTDAYERKKRGDRDRQRKRRLLAKDNDVTRDIRRDIGRDVASLDKTKDIHTYLHTIEKPLEKIRVKKQPAKATSQGQKPPAAKFASGEDVPTFATLEGGAYVLSALAMSTIKLWSGASDEQIQMSFVSTSEYLQLQSDKRVSAANMMSFLKNRLKEDIAFETRQEDRRSSSSFKPQRYANSDYNVNPPQRRMTVAETLYQEAMVLKRKYDQEQAELKGLAPVVDILPKAIGDGNA